MEDSPGVLRVSRGRSLRAPTEKRRNITATTHYARQPSFLLTLGEDRIPTRWGEKYLPRICSRDGRGNSLGLLVVPLAGAKFDEDDVNDSSKLGSSGAVPLKAV